LLHFQWTDYAALQLHNHGCRNLKYGTGHWLNTSFVTTDFLKKI
jgi:hypothetical protein